MLTAEKPANQSQSTASNYLGVLSQPKGITLNPINRATQSPSAHNSVAIAWSPSISALSLMLKSGQAPQVATRSIPGKYGFSYRWVFAAVQFLPHTNPSMVTLRSQWRSSAVLFPEVMADTWTCDMYFAFKTAGQQEPVGLSWGSAQPDIRFQSAFDKVAFSNLNGTFVNAESGLAPSASDLAKSPFASLIQIASTPAVWTTFGKFVADQLALAPSPPTTAEATEIKAFMVGVASKQRSEVFTWMLTILDKMQSAASQNPDVKSVKDGTLPASTASEMLALLNPYASRAVSRPKLIVEALGFGPNIFAGIPPLKLESRVSVNEHGNFQLQMRVPSQIIGGSDETLKHAAALCMSPTGSELPSLVIPNGSNVVAFIPAPFLQACALLSVAKSISDGTSISTPEWQMDGGDGMRFQAVLDNVGVVKRLSVDCRLQLSIVGGSLRWVVRKDSGANGPTNLGNVAVKFITDTESGVLENSASAPSSVAIDAPVGISDTQKQAAWSWANSMILQVIRGLEATLHASVVKSIISIDDASSWSSFDWSFAHSSVSANGLLVGALISVPSIGTSGALVGGGKRSASADTAASAPIVVNGHPAFVASLKVKSAVDWSVGNGVPKTIYPIPLGTEPRLYGIKGLFRALIIGGLKNAKSVTLYDDASPAGILVKVADGKIVSINAVPLKDDFQVQSEASSSTSLASIPSGLQISSASLLATYLPGFDWQIEKSSIVTGIAIKGVASGVLLGNILALYEKWSGTVNSTSAKQTKDVIVSWFTYWSHFAEAGEFAPVIGSTPSCGVLFVFVVP